MPFKIVRNDITKMNTEAIVNTANDHPTVGTGCDYAVYMAAGYEELLKYRVERIGFVEEGKAFITPGFNLQAKYIIHAVSPFFQGGDHGEERKLRSCYRRSLKIAKEYGIKSVSFPLISTGGFGYPKEDGMRVAIDEINAFLLHNDMMIFLVVFDAGATQLGEKIFPDLETYIDRNYVENAGKEEYGAYPFDTKNGERRSFFTASGGRRDPVRERRPLSGSYPHPVSEKPIGIAPEQTFEEKIRSSPRQNSEFEPRQNSEFELRSISEKTSKTVSQSISGPISGRKDQSASRSIPGKKSQPIPGEKPQSIFGKKAEPILDKKNQSVSESDGYDACFSACPVDFDEAHESKLEERIHHLSDTFSQYLMYLIQERKMENAEVYKRAIVDKKVFSKIKNNTNYHPNKLTALCLCVGAKLNLDESRDLLARAGYALSPCDKTDIIFSYFIENEIYDMIELDIQLEEHGLPCIIQ